MKQSLWFKKSRSSKEKQQSSYIKNNFKNKEQAQTARKGGYNIGHVDRWKILYFNDDELAHVVIENEKQTEEEIERTWDYF